MAKENDSPNTGNLIDKIHSSNIKVIVIERKPTPYIYKAIERKLIEEYRQKLNQGRSEEDKLSRNDAVVAWINNGEAEKYSNNYRNNIPTIEASYILTEHVPDICPFTLKEAHYLLEGKNFLGFPSHKTCRPKSNSISKVA